MTKTLAFLSVIALAGSVFLAAADFRPPAVPLVTHDPYFSIWSFATDLTAAPTKHWTGKTQSITSFIRIDGKTYRAIGNQPREFPALEQTGLAVLPTHTVYTLHGGGIELALTFFTPAFPDDLNVLSRPATYVTWRVHSTDGGSHAVQIYFDASCNIAVNIPEERVAWSRYHVRDVDVLRAGSQQQPVLEKSGDDLRIDWGYLYVAAPREEKPAVAATVRPEALKFFQASGSVPDSDDLASEQPYAQPLPVLAESFDLGSIQANPVSRFVVIVYDDLYSIEFLNRRLRPYWRRDGAGAVDLLQSALHDYDALDSRATEFDRELMSDLTQAGGDKYARLCALAYRQTIAAHKLTADGDGTPLFFSKENFSNGSIDTVDVTYPSSPFFLLFNPRLLAAQLKPILDYASLPRWKFPFAPHDLGRYPLANGQQYGGGEKTEDDQMPVEESGNMLLMMAGIAHITGNAEFAGQYWPVLTKWADYLRQEGFDPANQLCTDDFAGHLAHNANLSIKAILALAAYGKLAGMLGHGDVQKQYVTLAHDFARRWVDADKEDDHFRLSFDRPGTWSQKYNLVWDKLLDLNIFPREVTDAELAFYRKHENTYGLPLDNRETYTKLDWLTWTASLTASKMEFQEIFEPAYRFADESPSRVPLSDWYDTQTGKQVGFQARSVVGGIFIEMLYNPAIWKKYASRSMEHR